MNVLPIQYTLDITNHQGDSEYVRYIKSLLYRTHLQEIFAAKSTDCGSLNREFVISGVRYMESLL